MSDEKHKDETAIRQHESSTERSSQEEGVVVNSSGHIQELNRTFGFWSVLGLAVITDNAWGAGGVGLVVALYNGGGPGVMYSLIVGMFFYCFVTACLAELSSAIPSSANVYHWASVTGGPKYGRLASFFAGWLNCLAWTFGVASGSLSGANIAISIYSLWHEDYELQRWHFFVAYIVVLAIVSCVVLFGQRFLSKVTTMNGILCMTFWFVSLLVIVIMTASNGTGYASNSFVWQDFQNLTGWSSSGLVFCMGVLNGAWTIGTPDTASHLNEEVPKPRRHVPLAMLVQLVVGFITAFAFFVALLYGINDLEAVQGTKIAALPLAAVYQQATNNNAATTALLLIFWLNNICCLPGSYTVAGRMLWTIARDNAVPGSAWVRLVHPRYHNPFNAQLVISIWALLLGCIYLGNATAFNAFVGVSAILLSASYTLPILPNLLSRRRHVRPGPFWMPAKIAYPAMIIACAYALTFNVMYMFPFVYPVDAVSMNYSSVLSGGLVLLLIPWYLWKRTHGYVGPQVTMEGRDDIMHGIAGLTMAEEEGKRKQALLVDQKLGIA